MPAAGPCIVRIVLNGFQAQAFQSIFQEIALGMRKFCAFVLRFMTKQTTTLKPSAMDRASFVDAFGGIFEHSAWIAEGAFDRNLDEGHNSCEGLHAAMSEVFRNADSTMRLAVLNAHPDLAGKLAAAKRLTAESTSEQASAGLDALTDEERAQFTELNESYKSKFGFPFIIAVKGLTKETILKQFVGRVNNDRDVEFETACAQVEKIARLRLSDILPSNEQLQRG